MLISSYFVLLATERLKWRISGTSACAYKQFIKYLNPIVLTSIMVFEFIVKNLVASSHKAHVRRYESVAHKRTSCEASHSWRVANADDVTSVAFSRTERNENNKR